MPGAMSFCQSSLPSTLSKQRATSILRVESTELMKICGPQTIGVAAALPGMGAIQTTFSLLLKVSSRLCSEEEPLKLGPRQCGQFSARLGSMPAPAQVNAPSQTMSRIHRRIAFVVQRGSEPAPLGNQLGAIGLKKVLDSFPGRHMDTQAALARFGRHSVVD